jgi:hypothetical protein
MMRLLDGLWMLYDNNSNVSGPCVYVYVMDKVH